MRTAALLGAILLTAACGFDGPAISSDVTPPDGDDADGGDDGGPIPVGCYGSVPRVCLEVPAARLQIDTSRILFTDGFECLATDPFIDACVVAGTGMELNAQLVVRGSRPLIIVSSGRAAINGGAVLDASSDGTLPGAGGDHDACASVSPQDRGGGAGGTFGTAGGDGGNSSPNNGGEAGDVEIIVGLRGGCRGDPGGGLGTGGGAGGHSGGAIRMIATQIEINGRVDASGSGGLGAAAGQRGGGGGGSGGFVWFDTPDLVVNGGSVVMAQGGGGGEGSTLTLLGRDGQDPTPGAAALGGAGGSQTGGDGGAGAVNEAGQNGASGTSQGGGGGGGGGAGIIRCGDSSPTVNGTVAPPLS